NGVIDVNVRVSSEEFDTVDELKNYLIITPTGEKVALKSVATVSEMPTAPSIVRTNGSEKIDFTVTYKTGTELSVFNKTVSNSIDDLELNEDTQINLTGDVETLQNSIKDLGLMLIVSILLIYLVISAQFESFKKPLVIMVSIPLIVIGIGASLFITNT